MTRRLVHILVGLGVTLLAFGGWAAVTNSPQEPDNSPTQRQTTHTPSSPPAPTSSSARQRPTTPKEPAASTSTSATSETPTSTTSKTSSRRAERARAVKTARAFLGDLTARERDPKQWWQALEPHLSPQARTDMDGMKPDWVPPLELKPGGGVVVDEDAPVDAHQREIEVSIPTTNGRVGVTLRPTPGGDTYVVVRYHLPKGQ